VGVSVKFTKRTILLHGGQEMHILAPEEVSPYAAAVAGDDARGVHQLIGNCAGFVWLEEIFAQAAALRENEVLHVPLAFAHGDALVGCNYTYLSGFVCMNYCAARFSVKETAAALKAKPLREQYVEREAEKPYADWKWHGEKPWLLYRNLTVRPQGNLLCISTNGRQFQSLARACKDIADSGDDPDSWAHEHFDWEENTSKSVGLDLRYWYMGLNE